MPQEAPGNDDYPDKAVMVCVALQVAGVQLYPQIPASVSPARMCCSSTTSLSTPPTSQHSGHTSRYVSQSWHLICTAHRCWT